MSGKGRRQTVRGGWFGHCPMSGRHAIIWSFRQPRLNKDLRQLLLSGTFLCTECKHGKRTTGSQGGDMGDSYPLNNRLSPTSCDSEDEEIDG